MDHSGTNHSEVNPERASSAALAIPLASSRWRQVCVSRGTGRKAIRCSPSRLARISVRHSSTSLPGWRAGNGQSVGVESGIQATPVAPDHVDDGALPGGRGEVIPDNTWIQDIDDPGGRG